MEAPQCKICGERHYGLCDSMKKTVGFDTMTGTQKAIVSETVRKAQRATAKKSTPAKSSRVAGEAGAAVDAPAKPSTEHRLVTAAKEAAAMAKLDLDITNALNALLYNEDGSINEEAARAGHNAYTKLAMRKHRAKKPPLPGGE